MVYDETGRYPLYSDSASACLRYWLKLNRMPIARFPKQVLVMINKRLVTTGLHENCNWAGKIKTCLESYGFIDVWTDGLVMEYTFLTAFKGNMIERF